MKQNVLKHVQTSKELFSILTSALQEGNPIMSLLQTLIEQAKTKWMAGLIDATNHEYRSSRYECMVH